MVQQVDGGEEGVGRVRSRDGAREDGGEGPRECAPRNAAAAGKERLVRGADELAAREDGGVRGRPAKGVNLRWRPQERDARTLATGEARERREVGAIGGRFVAELEEDVEREEGVRGEVRGAEAARDVLGVGDELRDALARDAGGVRRGEGSPRARGEAEDDVAARDRGGGDEADAHPGDTTSLHGWVNQRVVAGGI